MHGYKIKVFKGYNFSRKTNVFKKYVEDIYHIKSNTNNKTKRQVAKSLLNNLLGRFGVNLDKAITQVMTEGTYDIKNSIHKIRGNKIIS